MHRTVTPSPGDDIKELPLFTSCQTDEVVVGDAVIEERMMWEPPIQEGLQGGYAQKIMSCGVPYHPVLIFVEGPDAHFYSRHDVLIDSMID